MSPNAVRLDALRSGHAPVLNTHRSGDARDVRGQAAVMRLRTLHGLPIATRSSMRLPLPP